MRRGDKESYRNKDGKRNKKETKNKRKHIRKRCIGTVNPLMLTVSDAIVPVIWPDP